ncbi:MAG: YIP1 family protein [Bacteroidota bacterium]
MRGIITAPSETFSLIAADPRWRLASVVVTCGLTALAWIKTCFDKGSLSFDLILWCVLFLILFTVLILVTLILAAFVFLSIHAFVRSNEPSFKTMFSVVVHTGIVFLLGEVANLVLVRLNILDPSSFPVPNRFPMGLDVFAIGTHLPSAAAVILYSFNVFTLWYFSILGLGVSVVTGLGKTTCLAIASSAWLLGVVFIISLVVALGGTSLGIKF